MATIKTTGTGTGLRVLTKTEGGVQRVSCSCCEEVVCCPYPADQFGVVYTEDDLPDTITFRDDDLIPRTLLRSGNSSGILYGPTFFDVTFVIGGVTVVREFSVAVEIDIASLFGLQWFISKRDEGFEYEFTAFSTCLYGEDDPENSSFSALTDTFADTFEVSGPVSGTVTRESLCVWSGEGLTLSNFGYQWKVNGRDKSGNQNTPVGSYADGYSVSA